MIGKTIKFVEIYSIAGTFYRHFWGKSIIFKKKKAALSFQMRWREREGSQMWCLALEHNKICVQQTEQRYSSILCCRVYLASVWNRDAAYKLSSQEKKRHTNLMKTALREVWVWFLLPNQQTLLRVMWLVWLTLLLHVGGKEKLTSCLYCHRVKEIFLPSSCCSYIFELLSSKISFGG